MKKGTATESKSEKKVIKVVKKTKKETKIEPTEQETIKNEVLEKMQEKAESKAEEPKETKEILTESKQEAKEIESASCDIENTEKKPFDKDDFYKILNKGSSRGEYKEITKKNYYDLYKNLMDTNLFNNGIHKATQESIIYTLNNLEVKGHKVVNFPTLKNYLNIIFLIFRYHNLEKNKLEEFNNVLTEGENKHYEEKKDILNEKLPDYKELLAGYSNIQKNAEEQLKNKHPTKTLIIKYLANYLLFNFFVRNLDIDVFITDDIEEVNKRISDSRCYENTLFIDNERNQIIYNRYKYKTFKTYGRKSHIIRTNLFFNCCKLLNNTYLLQKYDGSKIADSSLNKTVQSLSVKNLGEGNIFKILIDRALQKGKPLKEINKMFDLRGSSVEHLNNHYDLAKQQAEEKDFLDDEHLLNEHNI